MMGQGSRTSVSAGEGFGAPLDRLRAALDASCVVGTWDWDLVRRTVVYDAGAARLLIGDPARAETEIRGDEAIAAVHPDDHPWLLNHVQQAVRAGGLVLAEYRVIAPDGTVRWLLSRGRALKNPVGRPVRARGIIIDITEMREGGERYVFSGETVPADSLAQAADLAVAVRRTLGDDAPADVRIAVDLLLLSLGRAIAADSGPG
jgi:hypothetical protein